MDLLRHIESLADQECEQRIAALGKPKLVEQFQQAILERSTQPKAYAFIN